MNHSRVEYFSRQLQQAAVTAKIASARIRRRVAAISGKETARQLPRYASLTATIDCHIY
uniref:Uncharacterized protein n=1 Tax=Oryza brachyantha TaxID=4533 RepID=J3LUR7_ORYBR